MRIHITHLPAACGLQLNSSHRQSTAHRPGQRPPVLTQSRLPGPIVHRLPPTRQPRQRPRPAGRRVGSPLQDQKARAFPQQ